MEKHIIKVSSKLIKPSTPTPPTLRHLKISFIDHFTPAMNVSLLLFFSVSIHDNPKFIAQLQKSLEKTLIEFHPLAGRYVQEIHTVDCNDQGAEFILATLDVKLEHFLHSKENVNPKFLLGLFPSVIGAADRITDPILAIQVTTFECGGIALGVSISHRICDASTLSTFLARWAAISRQENEVDFTGLGFQASQMFPIRSGLPPPLELGLPRSITDDMLSNNVTKKLFFSDDAIYNFKKKAMLHGRKSASRWSKVQLVSALIVKALMDVDRSKHQIPRDCVVVQAINFREKTASFIPKHSCGNLWGLITTECGTTKTVEDLADVIRDSVKNSINNYSKVCHGKEEGQTVVLNSLLRAANIPPTTNSILLTSWCKFPFYETDFGFGKPIWASCGNLPSKNSAFLMDGVGGNGVEAYVSLEANEVPYFEEALEMEALAG